MRAGIWSLQQALTADAESIVKQAVGLARRRGHTNVTPLHVASSMLACRNGVFKRACLQSHSHPLQCKALELCFNVALNRLPASTYSALLGPHSSYPSLSNALVAAFKRAQAHQRRGSVENQQQQPILAVKIEMEQLIISILDDPSVSRVMREAGFSSTQVKNKVEGAVSLEICSKTTTSTSCQSEQLAKPQVFRPSNVPQSQPSSHCGFRLSKSLDHEVDNDEVRVVLKTLVEKNRNTIITRECLASTENIVRGVTDKIERGLGPGELRSARFISFPLICLKDLRKEEVEHKLVELRYTVKNYLSRGVVLYLGDINWVAEFWSNYGEQSRSYHCCAEHIIMELKGLFRGIGESERLRLLGIATFQTYMKCTAGQPSLETLWELYPLTIPVDSLRLSLKLDSNSHCQFRSEVSTNGYSWQKPEPEVCNHLNCCTDFSINFNNEAQSLDCSQKEFFTNFTVSTSSSLPPWLKQHKVETERITIDDKEYCTNTSPLLKKWNSFGSSLLHKESHHPNKTIKFASSPGSPISVSSHECNISLNLAHLSWPVMFEPSPFEKKQKIWFSECNNNECSESNLISVSKPELLSNPNSSPNSASSSEAMDGTEGLQSFKELNDQNMKILCRSLEKKVPWQKDIIPEIAATILECRSGISKSKCHFNYQEEREETSLFFSGVDSEGKQKIARELARLVYGSQANFVSIGLSDFSSTKDDLTEGSKNKRGRYELGCNYHERFVFALNENPHRVFLMEDIEEADYHSQRAMEKAIESGKAALPDGEIVSLKDAIVIFSCESFRSVSTGSPSRRLRTCKNEADVDEDDPEEKNPVISLDLNVAIDIDDGDKNSKIVENGILQAVDRQFIFKI